MSQLTVAMAMPLQRDVTDFGSDDNYNSEDYVNSAPKYNDIYFYHKYQEAINNSKNLDISQYKISENSLYINQHSSQHNGDIGLYTEQFGYAADNLKRAGKNV